MSDLVPAKNPLNTKGLIEASVSAVMTAHKSALDYEWKYVLGLRDEETEAMRDGTAVHALLLEPEKFYEGYFTDEEPPSEYTVLKTIEDLTQWMSQVDPSVKGRGKKAELIMLAKTIAESVGSKIIIYDEWKAEREANRIYIPKLKWDRLHLMKERVQLHKFVAKYLPMGKKEFRLEGEVLGVYMRGQVDWLVDEPELPYIICIDVKKVASAKEFKFRRAVEESGLHVQAACYTELVKQKFRRDCLFAWVALEATPPFHCEVYNATDPCLEMGMTRSREAVQRIVDGHATGVWPGYSNGEIQPLHLSKFEQDKAAELDAMEPEPSYFDPIDVAFTISDEETE